MGRIIFLVGLGGCIGSIFRYLVQLIFTRFLPYSFPLGTFAVNVIGSLVIGIIYGLSESKDGISQEWRFFLATGVCGGFTTFSTFAFENISFIRQGYYVTFLGYTFLSFTLGLGAVVVGIFISKL